MFLCNTGDKEWVSDMPQPSLVRPFFIHKAKTADGLVRDSSKDIIPKMVPRTDFPLRQFLVRIFSKGISIFKISRKGFSKKLMWWQADEPAGNIYLSSIGLFYTL